MTTFTAAAGELDWSALCTMRLDRTGRRWFMLTPYTGFTRHPDGHWLHVRLPGTPTPAAVHEVTSPTTCAALDRLEEPHIAADSDPTPPAGVVRRHLGRLI